MDQARLARVADLFGEALDKPGAERAAFIERSCGDDADLKREILSLLEADESSAEVFDNLAHHVVVPGYASVVGHDGSDNLLAELESALAGRYRIERELRGGAVSRVFLAEETALGRKVVVKVLPPGLSATMSGERFRREMQLAAQLQHPHIVPLLTSESSDRLLYYTMPFIAGESLRSRLDREKTLPIRDGLTLWRDVLEALAFAHASRVIHRDIKPANILLGDRHALVTDFGIARAIEAAAGDADATAPGLLMGTPLYMAPEQLTGDHADARSDLYAAALVMHEMLEGTLPFIGDSAREVAVARLTTEPRPIARADCPPALRDIVLRCLARDPAGRPASADTVLSEIEGLPGAMNGNTSRRRRGLLVTLAGLAAAAVIALVAAMRADSATTEVTVANPSMVILPLTSVAGDSTDAGLAQGVSEELLAQLSRGNRIRVMGSSSVLALQERGLDARQIAESLGVSHLLEGTLQRVGQRLRVQVRLVKRNDGTTLWSKTFDRTIGDVFAVQDDIARDVAAALSVTLATGKEPAPGTVRRPRLAAWEWYVRGKNPALLRNMQGRKEAVAAFDSAIALDSGFAAPWAGRTWALLMIAGEEFADHRELYALAEVSARKAVVLDSALADAHSALGWAVHAQQRWPEAERELTTALAADPHAHRAWEGLARIYAETGRPAEQLAAARRGLEIDPYSIQALREMALALNRNGRCSESLALLEPVKELLPPRSVAGVIRGLCFVQREEWHAAIDEFRWADDNGARAALGLLGYALARSGQEAEARSILADLESGRRNSHGAFGVALLQAGLRDIDRAFISLRKAVADHSVRVYIFDPAFAELQRDPRFVRIFPDTQKR